MKIRQYKKGDRVKVITDQFHDLLGFNYFGRYGTVLSVDEDPEDPEDPYVRVMIEDVRVMYENTLFIIEGSNTKKNAINIFSFLAHEIELYSPIGQLQFAFMNEI